MELLTAEQGQRGCARAGRQAGFKPCTRPFHAASARAAAAADRCSLQAPAGAGLECGITKGCRNQISAIALAVCSHLQVLLV
eukprot:6208870-Pleurochrysis_carterae.AAC.1